MVFSYTVSGLKENSKKLWKFSRYRLILTSATFPIAPLPLNLISNPINSIYHLIEYTIKKRKHRKHRNTDAEGQNNTTPQQHNNIQENNETNNKLIKEISILEKRCAKIYYNNLNDRHATNGIPKSIIER